MTTKQVTYIGDSVYAQLRQDVVVLTTEADFEIHLTPEVFERLLRYMWLRATKLTKLDRR